MRQAPRRGGGAQVQPGPAMTCSSTPARLCRYPRTLNKLRACGLPRAEHANEALGLDADLFTQLRSNFLGAVRDPAHRILIGAARGPAVGWCHRSILTVVVLCGEPPWG